MSEQMEFNQYDDRINKPDIMSQKYWEIVRRGKIAFLEEGVDPRENPWIRDEVAQSWVNSYNLGRKLHYDKSEIRLKKEALASIRQKSIRLIKVATPLIENYLMLAASSNSSLGLFDQNGVFLAGSCLERVGDTSEVRRISIDPSSKCLDLIDECTVGTTSHILAIRYKKPFQLIGPENYADLFANSITTSAPILAENGDVLGALVLSQQLGERPWENPIDRMLPHSLGWVSSLALAIKNQLKLQKANETLRATLEFIDDGVVAIDADGAILRANKEGKRIFQLTEVKGNIYDYLIDKTFLKNAIEQRKTVEYIERIVKIGTIEHPFLISVHPTIEQESQNTSGAVLRFAHSEKVNALVVSRSGASAKFSFEDIVGSSESINHAKNISQRFSVTRENILLLGESGTGKELFAQAIHNKYRGSAPFIAVNCAAMPRNLIESELFGYESGSFTGADKSGRPGKIELAHRGTLFLDEIGDMPFELQAVMLRVLQDKQVMRLGGKRYLNVDFRLIAATNQNLQSLVQRKLFREDLYFRLSVLSVSIPPLRERGYDIALLAEYFIKQYVERMGWEEPKLTPAALNRLLEYDWPGNVRQLENTVIYATNLAENGVIDLQHMPKELFQKSGDNSTWSEAQASPMTEEETFSMKCAEKEMIQKALSRSGNNVTLAAQLLKTSKTTLYRKMKEHNISTRYRPR